MNVWCNCVYLFTVLSQALSLMYVQEPPKSTSKGGKKTMPASFVEVIDCLMDVLLRYQGINLDPAAASQTTPGEGDSLLWRIL